jgi:uncharacterized protein (TIGR02147 family)
MISVFNFTDFREYLQYYYNEKKSGNPNFSYQLLAQKAGFSNRGFLYNIIKGKKPLSKSGCYKLSQALGHAKNEAYYFENIVAYAQAKNVEEQAHYLEEALQVQSNTHTEVHIIRQNQYEYYSKWYHSAIRALIDMYPFKDEYEEFAKKLSPKVTTAQFKKSIELLERLKLIKKDNNGIYRITDKSVWAGDEVSKTAITRFHVECTDLARNAIIHKPPDTHNLISLTMGISKKGYRHLCEETQAFTSRLVELVGNDSDADRVYQYQLFLVPLSDSKSLKD